MSSLTTTRRRTCDGMRRLSSLSIILTKCHPPILTCPLCVFSCRYESRVCPGADGGVSIFTFDITSRKKAESRLTVLAQVGQLLATSVESHLPSLLASMLG